MTTQIILRHIRILFKMGFGHFTCNILYRVFGRFRHWCSIHCIPNFNVIYPYVTPAVIPYFPLG